MIERGAYDSSPHRLLRLAMQCGMVMDENLVYMGTTGLCHPRYLSILCVSNHHLASPSSTSKIQKRFMFVCLFGLFWNHPSMGDRTICTGGRGSRRRSHANADQRRGCIEGTIFLNGKWTWTENSLIIELCAGIDGAGSTSCREGECTSLTCHVFWRFHSDWFQ